MKQKSGPDKAPAEHVLKDIRRQTRRHSAFKEVVADLTLENRLLKKSMSGDREDEA
jgi:transposase